MNSLKTQVGGSHYSTMKIQPVEFIIANNLPYLEGSILKYICRHRAKNGRQDLEKAAHYLQMLIEAEYPAPDPMVEKISKSMDEFMSKKPL